jgi:excisionase family DNA binding protein
MHQRRTYTVTEVAELLGISRSSAYLYVRRGEIPSLVLGRRVVVPRNAVDRLLAGAEPRTRPAEPVDGSHLTEGRAATTPTRLHTRSRVTAQLATRACTRALPIARLVPRATRLTCGQHFRRSYASASGTHTDLPVALSATD